MRERIWRRTRVSWSGRRVEEPTLGMWYLKYGLRHWWDFQRQKHFRKSGCMNSGKELGNVSCAQRAGCGLFRKASNARLRNLCLIVGTGNLLVFLNKSISWSTQCLKMRLSEICRTLLLKDWLRPGSMNFTWEPVRNPSPLPDSLNPNPQSSKSPRGICLPLTLREAQWRIDGRGTLDLRPVGGRGQSDVSWDGSRRDSKAEGGQKGSGHSDTELSGRMATA